MSGISAGTMAALLSVFLEDSFEGLDRAEARLLELATAPDPEAIAEVFRAIHSIKGGAGAFGVTEVTELAHVMENVLDDLRSGAMPTGDSCTALLAGVDELRRTLGAPEDARRLRAEAHRAICDRIRSSRPGRPGATPEPVAARAAEPCEPSIGWRVDFAPDPGLMHNGNDPLRILRELVELGAEVTADIRRVPALGELDPTQLFVAWQLRVPGRVSRTQIEEAFAWVDGECQLAIAQDAPGAAPAAATGPAAAARSAPAAPPTGSPVRAADELVAPAGALASVRVGVDKIDLLMNMVGELVITQSMLGELDSDGPISADRVGQLREGLLLLARNTRALQDSVMRLRSMPIGTVFARLPRLVHDLGLRLGKAVEIELSGQTTELDKTVLEKLGDPLVHIVRNSVDHGIETTEQRVAAGKPEHGTIRVHAEHRGNAIMIEVSDDGRGLDHAKILAVAKQRGLVADDAQLREDEIAALVFAPGFSTASAVSDVSGRGVGMDVVWRHLKEVGGDVHLTSTLGTGTRTTLRVPLTLAIIDGQLIRVSEQSYVMPLLSIVETVQLDPARLKRVGGTEIYRVRDDIVPVIDLGVAFGLRSERDPSSQLLMVVETDGAPLGLVVDELLAQQQIVVKSLETNYGRVDGLAGATVLGDGRVAFIIDIVALTRGAGRGGRFAA
jgi:two-component system chemotaxis sensor kinase CheA